VRAVALQAEVEGMTEEMKSSIFRSVCASIHINISHLATDAIAFYACWG